MAEVELETPDLDVDEDADRFRRTVAVLVVLITLFGAVVAYAQAVESNDEDVAARDAQRHAIEGLGDQVDSSTALAADLRIGSGIDAILQREALNAARIEAIQGDADSDVHLAARERLAAVAAAVADLTPVDPADGSTFFADAAEREERPDRARLRQSVEADLANDHGSKADTYVAILTVLAVALFLLGLSLTVQGRNRYVLLVPGVAVAVVCVAWASVVYQRGVTRVSETAIADVAAGQRLENTGDLDGAIARYDEAIDDSPDFAAAFARRASARFLQGSPQSGQTAFLSFTSPEALEDAVADLDDALRLGADSDVVTVADAGFFNFLAGDFERSVDLTSQALELNDALPAVWFNLGVAHAALGDEDAAEDAYEEGIDVLADEPSLGRRSQVLAGARTDLSIVRDLLDDDDLEDVLDLVRALEGRLAEEELAIAVCGTEACDADGSGELAGVEFTRSGATVFAELAVDGADDGTDLGVAWYFRGDPEQPFEQAALSFQGVEVLDGVAFASTIPVLEPACPVAGEYLVRVYAGDEFIGEAAAAIGGGVQPIELGDDGEAEQGAVEPDAGTPLGSSFTSLVDPVEGFEACVPEGFIVAESDVSELDAFTTYGPEDGELLIGINVTPGSILEGDDGQELEELLASNAGPGAELFPLDLQGRDLEDGFVFLEGTAAIGESGGFVVGTVVAVGPDTTTRTILVTAQSGFEDMEALLLEVAGTVTFTGVDTGAS